MDPAADAPEGLLASFQRVLRTLLALVQNRFELFAVEWQEERTRLVEALLLAAGVVIVGALSLVMVTLTIVVIFWETHRLAVMISLTVTYVAGAAFLFWNLRRRLKDWTPFAATVDELRKDARCLDREKI